MRACTDNDRPKTAPTSLPPVALTPLNMVLVVLAGSGLKGGGGKSTNCSAKSQVAEAAGGDALASH